MIWPNGNALLQCFACFLQLLVYCVEHQNEVVAEMNAQCAAIAKEMKNPFKDEKP